MKKLNLVIIALSLFGGMLLTTWGLAHMEWHSVLPWSGKDALFRFGAFLLISTIMVLVGSLLLKRSAFFVGSILTAVLLLATGSLWPLIVILWFSLASILLGESILRLLCIKLEVVNFITRFLVGAGGYGLCVGIAAHFPVSYSGVYGLALALPLILNSSSMIGMFKHIRSLITIDNTQEYKINKLDVAITVVGLTYIAVALMPEIGFDSLVTHLFVPAHMKLRHQWGFDVSTYVWAVFPMLGDWIFTIVYMLAGETAARLINVGFIFILGLLVRDIVLWAGGSSLGSRWAVLIFLTTPLSFAEGSSLFIESIWTTFVVAGTMSILRSISDSKNTKNELPVSGLFFGLALCAKAITFAILPVIALVFISRERMWCKFAYISSLILSVSLILGIGCVPYLTSWFLTGNPIFPMFNKVFQSHYFPIENFNNPLFNSGFNWDTLYRVTFQSGQYLEASAGASGFQWLLLLIPAFITLVLVRKIRGILLILVGLLAMAAVFHSQSYLRYVFPSWVILTSAIGVALSFELSSKTFTRYWWYIAGTSSVILNLFFFSAGSFYKDFPLKSIGDEQQRENYLLSRLPIRNAVELINHLNYLRTPVAVFSSPLAAGLSSDALYPNWYNFVFQAEITAADTVPLVANILMQREIDFVILDTDWGANSRTHELINNATDLIATFGTISVRKVKSEYRFKIELLKNPDFATEEGWDFSSGGVRDQVTRIVKANVAKPVSQVVKVSPGKRYLNEVVVRCANEPTLGRVQINWLDAKGQFMNTDIKTFMCSSVFTDQSMEVTAPTGASVAIVYAVSHTSIPIEFKRVSLRQ